MHRCCRAGAADGVGSRRGRPGGVEVALRLVVVAAAAAAASNRRAGVAVQGRRLTRVAACTACWLWSLLRASTHHLLDRWKRTRREREGPRVVRTWSQTCFMMQIFSIRALITDTGRVGYSQKATEGSRIRVKSKLSLVNG